VFDSSTDSGLDGSRSIDLFVIVISRVSVSLDSLDPLLCDDVDLVVLELLELDTLLWDLVWLLKILRTFDTKAGERRISSTNFSDSGFLEPLGLR